MIRSSPLACSASVFFWSCSQKNRASDSLAASTLRLPSTTTDGVNRVDIGGADKGVGKLTRRILAHEIFSGSPARSAGSPRAARRERPRRNGPAGGHGPFGQARIFDHQPFIGDEREARFASGLGRAFADQGGAFLMIDDHMAGRAACRRSRRHPRWRFRRANGSGGPWWCGLRRFHRPHIPPLRHRATRQCPKAGRTQRKLSVAIEAAPQRIDLGQLKSQMMAGMDSASTSAMARPGCRITAKYVMRPLTSRSSNWSRVTPFFFAEAVNRGIGRAFRGGLWLPRSPPRSPSAARARSRRGGAGLTR